MKGQLGENPNNRVAVNIQAIKGLSFSGVVPAGSLRRSVDFHTLLHHNSSSGSRVAVVAAVAVGPGGGVGTFYGLRFWV